MKKLRSTLRFSVVPLALATLLMCSPQSAMALSQTWGNTGTDFNIGTSWVNNIAPVTSGTAVFATSATTQPNLSANLSLGTLNFSTASASGYDLTASAGKVLTLTSVSTSGNGAINDSATNGANTIDASLIFGAGANTTQTITLASASSLIINGSVASSNSINLAVASTGTLSLNGANSYTGTTSQNAGSTIIIGNKAAFGTSTVNLASSSGKLLAATDLTGSNKLTNNIIWGANATISNSPTFGVELGGNVDLAGAARTINAANSAGVTFSGTINNDGGSGVTFLTSNSSLVTLSATNTYTGVTTIAGTGIVSVSNIGNSGSVGNLGAGTTINLGVAGASTAGSLLYTGAGETTSKTLNLAGATGGITIDQSGSGLLKFSSFTATGTGNKALTLQGSTAGTGEISSAIVDPGAGVISVVKAGTGTWTLSAANSYSGSTSVNGGALVLGNEICFAKAKQIHTTKYVNFYKQNSL